VVEVLELMKFDVGMPEVAERGEGQFVFLDAAFELTIPTIAAVGCGCSDRVSAKGKPAAARGRGGWKRGG